MAKQIRALPARKLSDPSSRDDSLLLRSAESLGRLIGALQRELESATRRLTTTGGNGARQPAQPRAAKGAGKARVLRKTASPRRVPSTASGRPASAARRGTRAAVKKTARKTAKKR